MAQADSKNTTNLLTALACEYAPYDTITAFGEGFVAYQSHQYRNPYDGVNGQAWDRGAECAMRYARAMRIAAARGIMGK
jgi:hypothetical protein